MFIIGIISIIIYIVAILMVVTNIYEFEKQEKIKFVLIGISIIAVISWVIVLFSSNSIQIDNSEYLKVTKMTSFLIFAPINTIAALPYFGHVLNKYKQKRLKDEQVKKRLLVLAIILFVIAIIEVNYIKSFQLGLLSSVIK